MATVPLSGTDIRFMSSVPFSNDYKNTRWFDSQSVQTAYFQSKPVTHLMSEATFIRPDGIYIKADKGKDALYGTNYVMFRNSAYSNKWFYAFVTKLEYSSKNMTKVHFEIDVFQTYLFDMDFKPSFVVREHCRLWNADGTPVINTVDEGLNYGTEYDNVFTYQFLPNGGYKWLVIVSKTPLESDQNKVVSRVMGTPQPLSYYVVPFRDNDSTPNISIDGELEKVSKPTDILDNIYKDENAVNNVVSMYVTDYIGVPTGYTPSDGTIDDVIIFNDSNSNFELVTLTSTDANYAVIKCHHVQKFSPIYEDVLDNKYQMYRKPKESKLLMYPYCMTILDDFKGNRSIYKNEYLNTTNLRLTLKGSLGTSPRTSVNLPEYNRQEEDGQKVITSNESALINMNASDVPIITDYLASYLQGNRNSIENQKAQIIFSGATSMINSGIGGVASAGGLNPIGIAAAATGVVTGAGNAILQQQGLMAKQQDIANVPPQIAKMGSNTAYDYGNGYSGFFVLQKQIKPEYQRKLEDFFNMFGYKVNEVKIPNFHTRENWNYVQTSNCNILANINHEDLNELKAVFDNGITLWHTDDVGNYSLENEVR